MYLWNKTNLKNKSIFVSQNFDLCRLLRIRKQKFRKEKEMKCLMIMNKYVIIKKKNILSSIILADIFRNKKKRLLSERRISVKNNLKIKD